MTTKERFEAAVADSKLLASRPDNDTLLQLYSYFKQATEGNAPTDGPSNPFDIVGRAKYQAWEALYGIDTETAMQHYIDLVTKLKG